MAWSRTHCLQYETGVPLERKPKHDKSRFVLQCGQNLVTTHRIRHKDSIQPRPLDGDPAAEGGGLDPQTLAGPLGLANRFGPWPIHLPDERGLGFPSGFASPLHWFSHQLSFVVAQNYVWDSPPANGRTPSGNFIHAFTRFYHPLVGNTLTCRSAEDGGLEPQTLSGPHCFRGRLAPMSDSSSKSS